MDTSRLYIHSAPNTYEMLLDTAATCPVLLTAEDFYEQ